MEYEVSSIIKTSEKVPISSKDDCLRIAHNRNYYLSRCLWYHAHFPFGQIIVADSSSEEKKRVNRETVAKVREKFGQDILYLEYEPETDKYGGDIYRKWGDAVSHVNKDYTLINADREFLFPNTLQINIDFLEKNTDYEYVCGKKYYLREKVIKNIPTYYLSPRNKNKVSENSNNPVERFSDSIIGQGAFQNSLLLNISHTKSIQEIYSNYLLTGIKDIRYGELYLGYVGHLYGKSMYIDTMPYKIRDDIVFYNTVHDYTNKISSKESSCSRYPYLSEYLSLGVNPEYNNRFMTALNEQLLKVTDSKMASLIIDNIQQSDLDHRFNQSIRTKGSEMYRLICKIPSLLSIWDLLPAQMKQPIILIFYRLMHIRVPLTLSNEVSIPKEYNMELEIILKTVNITRKHYLKDEKIDLL